MTRIREDVYVVRVDASEQIGSGHVMRTLTLALEFKRRGIPVVFICRESTGNLNDIIEDQFHFPVYRLPRTDTAKLRAKFDESEHSYSVWTQTDPETDRIETLGSLHMIRKTYGQIGWQIVDHYALDKLWESSIREVVDKIMVIDDLANREHDADLLLDQNFFQNPEQRYNGLLSTSCKKLLGPAFALLRPEFLEERKSLKERNGQIGRILLFFGGSDPTNETMKALWSLSEFRKNGIEIDVVVGNANPQRDQIFEYCNNHKNIQYHMNIDYMARLMSEADLFIGSGGTSTWERCCLGLPSIIIAIAENQETISRNIDSNKMGFYLGTANSVSEETIARKAKYLIQNPDIVRKVSKKCFQMVDGKGVSRVSSEMIGFRGMI